MLNFLFAIVLGGLSVLLILLVLVQRGRGGGLTGALGGMGGQSAFGTKAGDAFTRVTIVLATVWIITSVLAVKMLSRTAPLLGDADKAVPVMTIPAGTAEEAAQLLNEATGDAAAPAAGDAGDVGDAGAAADAGDGAAAAGGDEGSADAEANPE